MKVRFWGTRGSLPIALTAADVRAKVGAALRGASGRRFATEAELDAYLDGLDFAVAGTYGGHTSCVEIETGAAEYVLCDMGSGLRPFGQAAIARHGAGAPQTYHVFVSHVHWDHIMGLPFFTPAYIPGNRIVFYGGHAGLEAALRRQQEQPSFPVRFSTFGAAIEFVHLAPGRPIEAAGMRVEAKLQRHSGDSYAYRFEHGGRTGVPSTDSEQKPPAPAETQGFVDFFRAADVVIFDAMYSLAESISVKADWGHSSNIVGVELCQAAGVGHLCLFHHEPINGDETLSRILAETRRYEAISRVGPAMQVSTAYDGMEIDL